MAGINEGEKDGNKSNKKWWKDGGVRFYMQNEETSNYVFRIRYTTSITNYRSNFIRTPTNTYDKFESHACADTSS